MAGGVGEVLAPQRRDRQLVNVRVLGTLAVEANDVPVHVAGPHRRRLLALLASMPGRCASVDLIVDSLWGEDPPPSATKTVQAHVARLRRSLEPAGVELIETAPGGYRLAVEPSAVDAVRFDKLAGLGRHLLTAGARAEAAEALSAGLELWRGPAYVEFTEVEVVRAEATRLAEVRLIAVEDLADAQLGMGAAVSAIPGLQRLVVEEPGRERAWSLLMRALYAAGRQHDALDAFQRARRALAESFGLEPGPELRAVERQIFEQDPTLAAATGQAQLAAALRFSTPFIGRAEEQAALDVAWRQARAGDGQLRILRGMVDSGRTRLAADLAGRVLADGGAVEYSRGSELPGLFGERGEPGAVVDLVGERCRRVPQLLVVDDVEWASEPAVGIVDAIARATDQFALLLVLIVEPSAGGPAVSAVDRLDPAGACTLDVGPLADEDMAVIVTADGVEAGAIPAVLGVAAGLPGVARREAAAWAERTASERLRVAASSSAGAGAAAAQAQASVLDEVVELVAARARRDELRSPRWTGRQPYRALATYGPQDAELFVGRERLVAELAAKVLQRRLVVVVGPSGSGKSSIVRAGLVPLARSGRLPGDMPWQAHVVMPGRDPITAIDALADLDEAGPHLLVVDQFEEVFSTSPATVAAWAGRVVALAGDPALDVHVVLVVRADEYAVLTTVPGLAETVENAQLLVGAPSEEELRRIVVEPARRTGVAVEPGLVDLVAHDVGGYDTVLPLVSVAMAEVWERRDGGVLRAGCYVDMGGVGTAVERLGAQALTAVSPDDVRRVLLSLADVTDEGVWTRRRVRFDELPAAQANAVDALVDARLVVRGEDTVEIVHEVVFRAWPLLAGWLEAARADLVLERDLRIAARVWDDEGRTDDTVYRGGRLQAAIEWTGRQPTVPPLTAAFIEAGRDRSGRDTQQIHEQLAREVGARRRLARALSIAAVLLVLALVAGALAIASRSRADDERLRADDAASVAAQRQADAENARAAADRERDTARLARLIAESERELDSHLDLGLLLAAESYRRVDTPETRGALLTALTSSISSELPTMVSDTVGAPVHRTNSAFLGFMSGRPGRPIGLDISANGAIVASARYEDDTTCGCALALIFDTATRREIGRFEIPFPAALGIDLSPDGRFALARGPSAIYLFDVTTRSTIELDVAPVEEGFDVPRPFFTAGGDRFVVPANDGSLTLWDTVTHEQLDVTLPHTPAGLVGLAGDGALAIALADPPGVMFWDVDAAQEVRRVALENFPLNSEINTFAFAGDGSTLGGVRGSRSSVRLGPGDGQGARRSGRPLRRVPWDRLRPGLNDVGDRNGHGWDHDVRRRDRAGARRSPPGTRHRRGRRRVQRRRALPRLCEQRRPRRAVGRQHRCRTDRRTHRRAADLKPGLFP